MYLLGPDSPCTRIADPRSPSPLAPRPHLAIALHRGFACSYPPPRQPWASRLPSAPCGSSRRELASRHYPISGLSDLSPTCEIASSSGSGSEVWIRQVMLREEIQSHSTQKKWIGVCKLGSMFCTVKYCQIIPRLQTWEGACALVGLNIGPPLSQIKGLCADHIPRRNEKDQR